MPIASGASGRVDVGVDSSKTWSPDGMKRKAKPNYWNCDSYLLRYQGLQERQKKRNMLQVRKSFTDPRNSQNKGLEEEAPQQHNGDRKDRAKETPRKEKSKKSLLCVIL